MCNQSEYNKAKKYKNDLLSVSSFEEMIHSINSKSKILEHLMHRSMMNYRYVDRPSIPDFDFKITYIDVSYSNLIPNFNHRPANGTTNYYYSDKNPTGYPGYTGVIEATASLYYPSSLLSLIHINCGTGGQLKNNKAGYRCYIFLDDWVGLKTAIAEKIITGNDKVSDKFVYGEPEYFRSQIK